LQSLVKWISPMCGLCGMFESGRRWLDAAATLHPTQVRRERRRRVAIVRKVLKPARIAVDDWEGASFVLRGPTGRTEIVDNLFDLWRNAEALGHRSLDPLARMSSDECEEAGSWSRPSTDASPAVPHLERPSDRAAASRFTSSPAFSAAARRRC
jgi:hypothetical protein